MPDRYKNIKILKDANGRRYRTNSIYPEIPASDQDIYVVTTIGDRYDSLATQYYGDSSLWWIIASANESTSGPSLVPTPGLQIRIPHSKQVALDLYNNLNRVR
jgi:nucleoid-associated protein YgaU